MRPLAWRASPGGHHVIRCPRPRASTDTESQTHAKPNSKEPQRAALDVAGGRTPGSLGISSPGRLCLNEIDGLKQVMLTTPGLQTAPEPTKEVHLEYSVCRTSSYPEPNIAASAVPMPVGGPGASPAPAPAGCCAVLTHINCFSLTPAHGGRFYYWLHFTDGSSEAQRG